MGVVEACDLFLSTVVFANLRSGLDDQEMWSFFFFLMFCALEKSSRVPLVTQDV